MGGAPLTHAGRMYELRDKAGDYASLAGELQGLLQGEHDLIANAANTAALLFHALPDLNWAGFYFLRGGELVVGPFQGKPACVRIPLGTGVCGTAAARQQTLLVPDVHAFPGHIACDAASRSEIVVPLLRPSTAGGRELLGVLDLDSPLAARFDAEDARGLERLAAIFLESVQSAGP
jgi:L-methionine (R)-S-oxide reductase